MWTDKKIELLKEMYSDNDNIILSEILNISIGYIIKKANNLGLYKSKEYITAMRKKNNPENYWSDEDVSQLCNLYKTHSNEDISLVLNKAKKNIVRKLNRLGLIRTKDEKDYITAKASKKMGEIYHLI